jgi:hypothetical protein|tara:strand:- start:2274 stop:2492 length:219 start_codon:yes stop_codon:yes gene_type:complete
MPTYKPPHTNKELIAAYSAACIAVPKDDENLSLRVKLLKDIMEQRRESVDAHYRKESGQAPKTLGYNLDVKG